MIKKIQLEKIEMEGFKIYEGKTAKDFTADTIFVGGNGQGKSTIADAISWVFTGKIYDGKKHIENGILNVNSSKAVVKVYFIDELGNERTIKRTYTEASGISIWLDNNKVSQKALSSEIDIDIFLLNFNPCTFLSKRQQEARKLIIDMRDVSSITNTDVFNSLNKSTQNKLTKESIDIENVDSELLTLRKSLSSKEKELIVLNGHIDKNNEKLAIEVPEKKELVNTEAIETFAKEIEELSDTNPNLDAYVKAVSDKGELDVEISKIKANSFDNTRLLELTNKKSMLETELTKVEGIEFTGENLIVIESELKSLTNESNKIQIENNKLRNKVKQIRSSYNFKVGQDCPCCKQKISTGALNDIKGFVAEQTKDYIDTGISNNNTIEDLANKAKKLMEKIDLIKVENEKNKKDFDERKINKIKSLKSEISDIQKEITEENKKKRSFESDKSELIKPIQEKIDKLDVKNLKEKVNEYKELIKDKKKELKLLKDEDAVIVTHNKSVDSAIKANNALEKENTSYTKSISKIEKEIKSINSLISALKLFNYNKVKLIEDLMKKNFNKVSFKIEDLDENGEIKPCFKVFYDEKPIEQCSLSEQMKAGMEIVEMLRDTFEIDYPMFLDNSESIIEVKTSINQIIRTVVVDVPSVLTVDADILDEISKSSKDIVLKHTV